MNSKNTGIYKLEGIVRNYDWGGTEFLSKILSFPNPQRQPMAEYWLGAHDTASSIIVTESGKVKLNEFVASDKDKILGKVIAKKFGRLPYLLKILDVRDMLSVQVHPSKHMAEREFARENREKIPVDSPYRNYKDDNHKPELMVALNDFWLLHGFKPVRQLRETLQSIPGFKSLLEVFDATGYDQLYKTVMEIPQDSVNELLQPLLDRIIPLYENNNLTRDFEDFWAARAALTFNQQPETTNGKPKIDRGIFSIYFFNLLNLKCGEGIFQDAGVPHAYLEGQNVEIMANSDNVLRGGLTTKHIDVRELMKNVKFEETIPDILYPQKKDEEELYNTAAPDFRLSRFELKQNSTSTFDSVTGEIVFMISGHVSISSGPHQLELEKGGAAFIISHQEITLKAISDVDLYKASAAVHISE